MFRTILCLFVLTLSWIFPGNSLAKTDDGLTLIMKVSPGSTFASEYYIEDKSFLKQIKKSKKTVTTEIPDIPFAYLKLGKNASLVVSNSLNLYQPQEKLKWVLAGDTKQKLKTYLDTLKGKHFGEEMPWKDARQFLPRMGYAEVVDLETGLAFSVQRRAGSRHADVQPLTAKDSKIMKQIYGGKWSWKRRAILVKAGGHVIAASMNGMPHGAGAISGNDFPGHFCIHFKNSTTHKRSVPDAGHDYMVIKASGNLTEHLMTGNPKEISTLFISALQEKDEQMIPLFLNHGEQKDWVTFFDHKEQIESIKLDSFSNEPVMESGLEAEITATVNIKKLKEKDTKKKFIFHFTRIGLLDRWKLDVASLNQQLNFE